jgi:hypothetical protein
MFGDGVVDALWLTESDGAQVDGGCRLRFQAQARKLGGVIEAVIEAS